VRGVRAPKPRPHDTARRRATALAEPARTPDRPGPGPVPTPVLRSLDLAVRKRVESLIPGEHQTPSVGTGTELSQIRPYQPGDDVRQMDWNTTARTREPHVRVHVGERALTTWLVLDVSASMTFGTAERRKADVAEGTALAVGHVASRRGNRLGVVAVGGAQARVLPPRQGRLGLLGLLATLREEPEADGAGAGSLGGALGRVRAVARARGLVVVVSDFRGPRDWGPALRALRARHGLLCAEIRDPRELELPSVGSLWMVDPETGDQLQVDTGSRRVRERFAAAAAEERAAVGAEIGSAGADHVILSTSGDWLHALAGHLRRTERAGRPRAAARAHANAVGPESPAIAGVRR